MFSSWKATLMNAHSLGSSFDDRRYSYRLPYHRSVATIRIAGWMLLTLLPPHSHTDQEVVGSISTDSVLPIRPSFLVQPWMTPKRYSLLPLPAKTSWTIKNFINRQKHGRFQSLTWFFSIPIIRKTNCEISDSVSQTSLQKDSTSPWFGCRDLRSPKTKMTMKMCRLFVSTGPEVRQAYH